MQLRWVVIVPIVYLAIAAVSGVLWGVWAAFSLVQAAAAFAVATVIMLWIRFGRRRRPAGTGDEEFAGYPQGHVLAAMPAASISSVQTDLRQAGFTAHDVLTGEHGRAVLDPDGTTHGTPERVERAVERLFADIDDLRGYRDVLERGDAVVRVRAEDEEEAERITAVLQNHGGSEIHYFGALVVQRMGEQPDDGLDQASATRAS
jgi:hypothetical protein